MKFYLASRYFRRQELTEIREKLVKLGHQVTSRWLDGNHEIRPDGHSAEAEENMRRQFAQEDLADLNAAECVVSFTEEHGVVGRGGRHVEFGFALAMGLKLVVVGPKENIFHCLGEVEHFATVAEWLRSLGVAR